MEPTQGQKLKVSYTIHTTVVSVAEEFKTTTGYKDPDGNHPTVQSSLGWFILFEGSREKLYFGLTKPNFDEGDEVVITFTKKDK